MHADEERRPAKAPRSPHSAVPSSDRSDCTFHPTPKGGAALRLEVTLRRFRSFTVRIGRYVKNPCEVEFVEIDQRGLVLLAKRAKTQDGALPR